MASESMRLRLRVASPGARGGPGRGVLHSHGLKHHPVREAAPALA